MEAPREGEAPPPRARFLERWRASLAEGSIVRLVLSSPRPAAGEVRRATARLVDLRGHPMVSVVSQEARRDLTHNLPLAEAESWLEAALEQRFAAALLETTQADWQWRGAPAPAQPERLVRHAPRTRQAPPRVHDHRKTTALDGSANDWLRGLGLVDARGEPLPSRRHKVQQLQRFAELLGHLVSETSFPSGRTLHAYDMGCGRGALTFAAWQVLRRQRGLDFVVHGIEVQPALVAGASDLAHRLPAPGLSFHPGTIASTTVEPCDLLLALHACDTATDQALVKGLQAAAHLVIVAPCCHQEVRPQLATHGELAPLLEHGLLATRFADLLTDGLRALFLEWAGYRVKVIEFVDPEHTPRNLLLSAVRDPRREPFADEALRHRLAELRRHYGIRQLATDSLRAP